MQRHRHMPSFSKGLPTERLCQPVSSTQLQADGIKARRQPGKKTYRNERSEKSCTATSGQIQFSGGSGSVTFSQAEEQAEPMVQPVVWAQRWRAQARKLRSQLNSYGISGLLAYGLLNTLYYSGAFLIIWTYFAKVPRGMGWSEVVKQFSVVMGLTWAASQATKVPRAGMALVLAPVADGLLIFVQARLRLRTRQNAFAFLVGTCLLLAGAVFGCTLMYWA